MKCNCCHPALFCDDIILVFQPKDFSSDDNEETDLRSLSNSDASRFQKVLMTPEKVKTEDKICAIHASVPGVFHDP